MNEEDYDVEILTAEEELDLLLQEMKEDGSQEETA